jgi:two-component system, OmpR family, sensor histidine kinase SenX3
VSTALVALVGALVAATVAVLVTHRLWVRRLLTLRSELGGAVPLPVDRSPSALIAAVERTTRDATNEAARSRATLLRLQAAVDALPQGVVVTTRTGEVQLRNAAAQSFLGTRTGDALVDEALRLAVRVAGAGDSVHRTIEVFGPPRRTVELTALPIDGGALVELEDVTERARLEAVRTDFVANISHELRTPVGALALLAETLIGEDDLETVAHLAGKMVFESHRVARIIEDLLELSRIELGEPPVREPVDISRVVGEAVERVRALAESRQVSVHVEEDGDRLCVLGDSRQLVSAVANLLENGVKYSDAGSVVEASTALVDASVSLVVTDHGIGIPSGDLDRVFERFYRVDRARSRETGGTGLGLAIVRHVATNHGGSVAVESQEGLGSVFTLRLPAAPVPAVSAGAATRKDMP